MFWHRSQGGVSDPDNLEETGVTGVNTIIRSKIVKHPLGSNGVKQKTTHNSAQRKLTVFWKMQTN